jgi:hypothetical protein
MNQTQSLDISSVFDKSGRKMYTIFSAVLHVREQRESDVMTSFGHSGRSAVYYKAGSPLIFHFQEEYLLGVDV